MKIYVLEHGECADDRGVKGVFSTPEKAMESWRPEPPAWWGQRGGYFWIVDPHEPENWVFEAPDMDAAFVTPFEVDS